MFVVSCQCVVVCLVSCVFFLCDDCCFGVRWLSLVCRCVLCGVSCVAFRCCLTSCVCCGLMVVGCRFFVVGGSGSCAGHGLYLVFTC